MKVMKKHRVSTQPHGTRGQKALSMLAGLSCRPYKAEFSFRIKAKDLDPDGLGQEFKKALVENGILDMDKAHDLVTAMVEALINARDYGCLMLNSYIRGKDLTSHTTYHEELEYRMKDARWCNNEVGISISINEEKVTVRVSDPGKGIPKNLPMPSEILPHGRGIMIMKRLTDRLTIRRNPSVVAMTKFRT